MNTDSYQYILGLSGGLISILLIIIGFFLRQQINATKSLTESVNLLKTSVEVLKASQSSYSENERERHEVIERRLNNHHDTLSDHEKRILKLER